MYLFLSFYVYSYILILFILFVALVFVYLFTTLIIDSSTGHSIILHKLTGDNLSNITLNLIKMNTGDKVVDQHPLKMYVYLWKASSRKGKLRVGGFVMIMRMVSLPVRVRRKCWVRHHPVQFKEIFR